MGQGPDEEAVMPELIDIPDETPWDLLWQCAWQANAIEWMEEDFELGEPCR